MLDDDHFIRVFLSVLDGVIEIPQPIFFSTGFKISILEKILSLTRAGRIIKKIELGYSIQKIKLIDNLIITRLEKKNFQTVQLIEGQSEQLQQY